MVDGECYVDLRTEIEKESFQNRKLIFRENLTSGNIRHRQIQLGQVVTLEQK